MGVQQDADRGTEEELKFKPSPKSRQTKDKRFTEYFCQELARMNLRVNQMRRGQMRGHQERILIAKIVNTYCSYNIFGWKSVFKNITMIHGYWLLFTILDHYFFLTPVVVSFQELFFQLTGQLLVTDLHQGCHNVWYHRLSKGNTWDFGFAQEFVNWMSETKIQVCQTATICV